MAAPSIWSEGISGHGSTPPDDYDAFLRSPRDKNGELRLTPRDAQSEDAVIFREVLGER